MTDSTIQSHSKRIDFNPAGFYIEICLSHLCPHGLLTALFNLMCSMKKLFLVVLTAAFVLCFLPTRSTSAKETWRSVRSKNFYLIGNAGDRDIRQVATKLEQFRQGFSKLYPKARLSSGVPITVIVFKSSSSFTPFMPVYNGKTTRVGGYFQPGEEANYILLTSDMSGEHPYRTIYHEFVHSLVNDNTSSPLPVWFNEGIAEVYSTFEVTSGDKSAILGAPVNYHLETLQENKLIPLQRLLSIKHDSPEYNENNRRSIFYSESWALVHYLMLGNGHKRQPQLSKFIDLVTSGKSTDDAFTEAFQTDYATLQKELMNYCSRTAYPALEIHFDEKLSFDKDMVSAEISEAEGEFNLGNCLNNQGRPDAEVHLLKAISIDPNMAEALAVLGKLRVTQGNVDEAKGYLEKASNANSKSYLAHYYYALALSKEGQTDRSHVSRFTQGNVEKMRAALGKAIQINPQFVASYQLLGFINLVENEQIDESISMLTKASAYAPGRQNLNFILGQLYLRKLNFDMARKLIAPIARDAENPQSRANAQRILTQIDEMSQLARKETQDTFYKEDKGQQNKTEPVSTGRPTLKRKDAEENECGNFEGEHVKGLLVRVECKPNSITLYIKTDSQQTVKFQTDSLDTIATLSCGGAKKLALECGALETTRPVTIYYRKLEKDFGILGEPFAMLIWP